MTDRCSHCNEDKKCKYHLRWGYICEDCLKEIKSGVDVDE